MRPVTIGLILGVAGGAAASRLLTSLLFGLNPFDPTVYVGVALFLIAVAFLATYLPARRAASVDPMIALRNESMSGSELSALLKSAIGPLALQHS